MGSVNSISARPNTGGVPKSAETAAVESLLWHGQCVAPLSYFFVTLIWKPLVLGDFDLS